MLAGKCGAGVNLAQGRTTRTKFVLRSWTRTVFGVELSSSWRAFCDLRGTQAVNWLVVQPIYQHSPRSWLVAHPLHANGTSSLWQCPLVCHWWPAVAAGPCGCYPMGYEVHLAADEGYPHRGWEPVRPDSELHRKARKPTAKGQYPDMRSEQDVHVVVVREGICHAAWGVFTGTKVFSQLQSRAITTQYLQKGSVVWHQ